MADAIVRYDWDGRNAMGVPRVARNRPILLLARKKWLVFQTIPLVIVLNDTVFCLPARGDFEADFISNWDGSPVLRRVASPRTQ
jgi:hypothetical protein